MHTQLLRTKTCAAYQQSALIPVDPEYNDSKWPLPLWLG